MTGTLTRIRDTGAALARTPLRTELRRGIPPWTGAAVTLTLLVTLGAKADQWQGDWGETHGQLRSASTLLCGPLTAAAACWQGGRERRARTAELLSGVPRSRLRRAVTAAAPVALWAAVGYLVALAVLVAANLPYAAGRGPSLPQAVSDSCFLVSIALVGFVVGRLSPWRLTAPVLAVCTYVGLGIPAYLQSEFRYLSPGEQAEVEVPVPVWWLAPVMVVWLGGLALAVLLGYAARRRLLAVVPLIVAVAAGALIVRTGDELWRDDAVAARRICTDGLPQICVNGHDGPMLAQVSDALSGMLSRLDGVPHAPTRYVEYGAHPGSGDVPLPGLTLGWDVVRNKLVDPRAYAQGAASQLMMRDCPAETRRESEEFRRVYRTESAVRKWLSPESDPGRKDPEVESRLARLRAMPDTDRRAWLGRYLASRQSCDPAEVPAL
ncbi:hypothetical protein ACWD7C_01600 [Streptomyces sp. NPDC005134]|uniref:hypothetical protein n=1 Tax=unclassified Streptomyces TaxID=2593676 RepID=UPI0033A8DABA